MKKRIQKFHKQILVFLLTISLMGGSSLTIKAEEVADAVSGSSTLALLGAALTEAERAQTIKIQNVEDLLKLAKNCALDSWSQDKEVVLQADIYVGDSEFEPIATFGGTFDGKGHTISGLEITDSISPAGFFGVLQEGAVVKNLNVSGKVAPSGVNNSVGGIAGENSGLIKNCTFTGMVEGGQKIGGIAGENGFHGEIQNCRVSGVVLGEGMTGGVIGYNQGTIWKCKNTAKVNHISVEQQVSVDSLEFDISVDMTQWSDTSLLETVSDTGGIAGYSAGVIESCENSGMIGYPHIGYNLGGIVGRSSGYVADCTNSGEIFGRKDVGGIVGQMEPYIDIELSESGIAKIQNEMQALDYLLTSAEDHAEESDAALTRRVRKVQASAKEIQKLLEELQQEAKAKGEAADQGDAEDSDVEGAEASSSQKIAQLQVQLQLLQRQMQLLGSESIHSAGTLTQDIKDITAQAGNLSDTVKAVLKEAEELSASDFVTDISLESLQEATYGKVAACENSATVQADLNVGGIVGSMSMETGVDPEDDLTAELSMKERQQYKLTTIAFDNVNRGAVTSKKNYVGGICGRMDLGLIASCENYGAIVSQNGDYIGGIAGLTGSTIQDSFAKCTLSGSMYIGGVVGAGVAEDASGASSMVVRCYTMVDILSSQQFTGAIAGANIGQYDACAFVSEELQGINRISYEEKAEPITYEKLLKVQGLPEEFESLTLSFVANEQVVAAIAFEYGDSFEEEELPEVPLYSGLPGQWETTELKNLKKDTTINAVYELPLFTLASKVQRADGRALFLAEGQFAEDSEILVSEGQQHFNLKEEVSLTDRLQKAAVLEQWKVTLPEDGLLIHTLRYLPENTENEKVDLYIGQDGRWELAERDASGSYLLFDIAGTEAEIAVVSRTNTWWLWLAGAVVIILAVVGGIWLVRTKKDIWKWLVGVLAAALVVCSIVIAVLLFYGQPGSRIRSMYHGAKVYELLQNYAEQPKKAMKLDLELLLAGEDHDLEADIFCTMLEEQQVICLEIAGASFYYSEGILYLENGNAYQVGEMSTDYMGRLEVAAGLTIAAKEKEDGKSYSITLEEDQDGKLKEPMLFEVADKVLEIYDLDAEIFALEEGKEEVPDSITLTAEGNLQGDEKDTFKLEAVLTIEQAKNLKTEIPASVKDAILSEDTEIQAVLTRDVLRLYRAWEKLYGQELLAAQVTLTADCGSLNLEEELTFISVQEAKERINCMQKDDFTVYFNEDTICSEKGYAVTTKRAEAVKATDLLGLAYEMCVQGDFRCVSVEDTYIYTIALDEAAMADIAALIAKDSVDLPIQFENGSLQLILQEDELQSLRFACDGQIDILLTKVAAALSAEFEMQAPEQFANFSVPEKVVEKLTGEE